ncbi:MAG: hypothetical protein A2X46_14575 [Lentisphaerae bacterium GWF2_57_35]|nr:MAG: hypothetical protein A2X46_14575 [Lentisphaerae bacterium GWF2_57_35]
MFFYRVHCLLVKELAQIRRDPRIFGLLVAAPLIQLLVMGYAATTDVRDVNVAVRDNDHSYHSREYIRSISSSGYLKTTLLTGSAADDVSVLAAGRAGLIIDIPPQFGRRLIAQQPVRVQVLVDGADSNFAVQGLNYLMKATRLYAGTLINVIKTVRPPALGLPQVSVVSRVWYNPDLRSTLYMVPGIMGVLLLVTTMMVSSMALVKEREDGTMEQLIVTPLRPVELVTGKLLPFVVVGFVEVSLALPVILFIFGVPLRGNLLLLYLFSGLFLLNTLGFGLLVSTLVKTQQQAMMVSAFFVMMPFVLLSGFIFPVENMPKAIQYIAYFIPLKYYLTAVRGVFLKGAGWAELWPQAAVLLGMGTAVLGLAVTKFHKRLD